MDLWDVLIGAAVEDEPIIGKLEVLRYGPGEPEHGAGRIGRARAEVSQRDQGQFGNDQDVDGIGRSGMPEGQSVLGLAHAPDGQPAAVAGEQSPDPARGPA